MDYGYGGMGMDLGMDTGGGFLRSPDKSGNKIDGKKPRDKMSATPLTIRQIYQAEASEDSFRVDGVTLHMIRIVGTVESVEQHSTNAVYRINDNTGSIDCKLWNDNTSSNRYEECVINSTVCIFGNIKDYGESKKNIQIINMHHVSDYNERTHHFLESILVHLQNTRGPIPGSVMKQELSLNFSTPAVDNGMKKIDGQGDLMINGKQINRHGNPEVNKLYAVLLSKFQTVFDESGISRQELAQHARKTFPNYTDALFNEAMKELDNNGYIYCTLDENHFACAIDW